MATQLVFTFPSQPRADPKPAPQLDDWRDVSDIAHQSGWPGAWWINIQLYEQLDDQALYDVLWTAGFMKSLDHAGCVLFTLEIAGVPLRLKVLKTNQAVHLGRLEDF
jgi:hypothetical protein